MNISSLDSKIIKCILKWYGRYFTAFEAIASQFRLEEEQVVALMRREMKESSYLMWRERVSGRKTKHMKQRDFVAGRFRSQNKKGF